MMDPCFLCHCPALLPPGDGLTLSMLGNKDSPSWEEPLVCDDAIDTNDDANATGVPLSLLPLPSLPTKEPHEPQQIPILVSLPIRTDGGAANLEPGTWSKVEGNKEVEVIKAKCSMCGESRVLWVKDNTSCSPQTCQECVASWAEKQLKHIAITTAGSCAVELYCPHKCHRLNYQDLKDLWEIGYLTTTSMSRAIFVLNQEELRARMDGHESLVLVKCTCGDHQIIDVEFNQWATCHDPTCGRITCAKHQLPVSRRAKRKVDPQALKQVYYQEIPCSIYHGDYVRLCEACLVEAVQSIPQAMTTTTSDENELSSTLPCQTTTIIMKSNDDDDDRNIVGGTDMGDSVETDDHDDVLEGLDS